MALRILDDDDELTIKDSELVDGGDTDTNYTVRVLPSPLMAKIKKDVSKKKKHGMIVNEAEESEALTRAVIDYMLVSWSGVVRGDGTPVDPNEVLNTKAGPMAAKYVAIDQERYLALLNRVTKNEVLAAERKEATFRPTP